ncbi:alpha-hydroxy-acid oxidizing protein [Roseococcus sp. SDR]|uniref:alpha-hydroxy acid oxidase n=1 Tax=Roseococcus sp. SDR TaxID=2835532 RepID=UPI001BCF3DD1|nr:alpha-hydroxy acid oxidase [Roseococcus sp. SDR]MBS7791863.1 alpha-hydroxy-acid oxidizing protein [Roseococcus sp. SDR]MBV1847177.1 alpha-hydroxy-acid oxidizing protein [Roseococcus sp. SDR]
MRNFEERYQVLHEFVKAAKIKLNHNVWDYLVGATETETTLARNRMAIDTVALRPRVLNDVSKVDPSVDFFGHRIRLPVFCAPVGSLESFEPGGGVSVAKGSGAFGVPYMLSSVSQPGLEACAEASKGPKVFQLYVRGDDAFVDDYVRRVVDSGYDAFCMTVDTAHYSRRERDIAKRFVKTWRAANTGMDHQAALSWREVARFKEKHKIPLILKGIGTGEDAAIACEHGVDVIYVSNHGGRQLDGGRGSLDVLPEVVEAVAGRAKIMVDGSFSRGTDIVKAVALGADWVGLGRLYLYGLAAEGADGIERLLEILEDEVIKALGLTGVNNFGQLTRGHVHIGAPPVVFPNVHSAFPLLKEGY